jgi:hypothetical protein
MGARSISQVDAAVLQEAADQEPFQQIEAITSRSQSPTSATKSAMDVLSFGPCGCHELRALSSRGRTGSATMNRRSVLSLSAITALALPMLPTNAVSQQKTIKEQIVGTWTFVSSTNVMPDGTKIDQWAGSNPKGIFMLDGNGHFAFFITRSDLPKFAGKTVPEGTSAEYKAVMTGFVGSFGTYTVNEADKTIITHVEGSSFPNLIGLDQKRLIKTLTGDELIYGNPVNTASGTVEATWKRAK